MIRSHFSCGCTVFGKEKPGLSLDSSGTALNRRGYRTWNGEAPLRETLAAALVELSPTE